MKLYSTNNTELRVDFAEAVLKSLPKDNGLYLPVEIPKLPRSFFANLKNKSFAEMSFEVANLLIGDAIPDSVLRQIVEETVNFEAPLINIHDNIYALELFHGPTLAFKDFGARFMSRVMKYFKAVDKELYILVATSGDTGGAVASGFLGVDGIKVVILFPKGKVSPLQQKQLTTLGQNITAIEIDGTFDDCQAIVKEAFLDEEVTKHFNLSSANSINISRLIPQSFYYFYALSQLTSVTEAVFVVPSGNYGNITAGILGQQMGLPVEHFVAATNVNNVVPEYIKTGQYKPRPSTATISNAMDVGNPSNFPRLFQLYGSTWNIIKDRVKGYFFTDNDTKATMKSVYENNSYMLDPHGAVGYQAALAYKKDYAFQGPIIVLETAHPSKFLQTVESTLEVKINVPERLAKLTTLEERYTSLDRDYKTFKKWFTSFAGKK